MKSAACFLTALALLSGCQIPEKMPGLSPHLPKESQGGPQSFTEITMNHFLSMTAPPQGITNPPQGMTTASASLTSPPQGVTSPPQGVTASPLGIATPLERGQFNQFDGNKDGYWDKAELATYIQAWDSLYQSDASGFGTKSLSTGLSLDPAGLMDTYDRSHDRLLDFEEARLLHAGLRQTISQVSSQIGSLSGETLNQVNQTVHQVSGQVNQTVNQIGDQTLDAGQTAAAVSQSSAAVTDTVTETADQSVDQVAQVNQSVSQAVDQVSATPLPVPTASPSPVKLPLL